MRSAISISYPDMDLQMTNTVSEFQLQGCIVEVRAKTRSSFMRNFLEHFLPHTLDLEIT